MTHLDSPDCWCIPIQIITPKGNNVWVHREPGEEPPKEVVEEAIRIADEH